MSEGENVWAEIERFTAAILKGGKVPIRPGEMVLGIRAYNSALAESEDLEKMRNDLKLKVSSPEAVDGLDTSLVFGMWYVGYLAMFPEVIGKLVAIGPVRAWQMEVSEENKREIHSIYVVLGECGKGDGKSEIAPL